MSLHVEDRQAVDMLLDRTPAAAANGGARALFSGGQSAGQDRLQNAQQVLQLLDLMPPVEPPTDLLARTLRRIEESAQRPAAEAEHAYRALGQPLA